LPKIHDFTPEFCRRFRDGNVITVGEVPKSFWARVPVIKTKSKFFRHYVIAPVHHDPDQSVIIVQIIF